jgi:hypothetical protein
MRILDKVTKKIAIDAGFDTAKRAKEFIEHHIPNYKELQFNDLLGELKIKYNDHLIRKAKEINDDINEKNVKVFVINKRKINNFNPIRIFINIDKGHEQYKNLFTENGHTVYNQAEYNRYIDKLKKYGISYQIEELPNEFNPKWIHINNEDFYGAARKVLSSEKYNKLLEDLKGTKDLNRIMYSQGEYDRYIDRIKRTLYKYNIIDCFDDIKIKELYHDEEIGRYYKINGQLFDYGSFLIDKFTYEAPVLKSSQGIELRCVLNCIISQTKLGKKQLNQLYLYNDLPITLDILYKISEDFKLHIRVYDCELNLWREYDNLDRSKSKNYERLLVCIVVKNGHAYNIKPEYRKYTELKPKSSPKVSINPRDDKIPEAKYGSFTFNSSILLDGIDIDCILECDDNITKVYYSVNEINYLQLVEYLISKRIYPCILSSKNTMISLNFKHKGNEIQLRNIEYKHDYITDIPYDSNYTLTSVAKYLFTRHIERSVLCLHDPVMINIFKSLCIPKNQIDQYDLRDTNVYQIDLNKAYRSLSKNIGLFDISPNIVSIDKPITKRNTIKPGIYYSKYHWLTNEQLEYALTKNSVDVKYAIYFDYQSDIIHTFADYLTDCPDIDIDNNDIKLMFNSFVGSLHPSESEHNMTMVFKDDKDLSRFLMCGQKHIDYIRELDSSYIVSFRYYDTITSQNAHHIAAQIISRCKLYIEKVTDQILSKYPDTTIIGSMTDSIIFANKQELDLSFIDIGPDIGQFTKIHKRNIVSKGPGQYCLFDDEYDSNSYIMKMQGVSTDRTLDKLLTSNKLLEVIRDLKVESIPKQIEFSTKNTNVCDLFIGGPGIGKSRYIDETFICKSYIRLASTGIAACSINGRTISSYFNLGETNQHTLLESLKGINHNRRNKIANADAFIIDECYATSEKVMTLMSDILKFICCDHRDFGNKELILFGDDRQLSFNIEEDVGFMKSGLFKRLTINKHDLPFHEDGRLTTEYYNTLNYLRHDRSPWELSNFIKSLNTTSTEFPDAVTVTYTNNLVQQINNQKYSEYNEPEHIHVRTETINDVITTIETKYKKGMPIMLKKNDDKKNRQVYNGKLCTLLNYEKALEISYNRKKDNTIVRHEITLGNYHSFVLAYAITIHKVQGLTLDNINIMIESKYLSHPDATRLLYVALSRVREAKNVYIKID